MTLHHAPSSTTVSETESLTTSPGARPFNAATIRSLVDKSVGLLESRCIRLDGLEAMTDQAFEAGTGFERYSFDGAARLQQRLRNLPQYANAVVTPANVTIVNADAVKATEAQWAIVQQLQQVFPDAPVVLREHRISWKDDSNAPSLTMYGVIVTCKIGPFDLRREYAAPDS